MSGSVKIVGTVTGVGELYEKGEFRKRDLIVKTDGQYAQVFAIEFVKEKEAELDFIEVNERVEVECNLRGREWKNQQGQLKHFISLQAWKIQKIK